jgi:tetratricopeptide (TPR) repeat protein/predicted Ser/Thr protein kinase
VPLEPRDERFIEFAVASGLLDPALAQRLRDRRRVAPQGGAIESFAIEQRFLSAEAIARIRDYARTVSTSAERPRPSAAPRPTSFVGSPSPAPTGSLAGVSPTSTFAGGSPTDSLAGVSPTSTFAGGSPTDSLAGASPTSTFAGASPTSTFGDARPDTSYADACQAATVSEAAPSSTFGGSASSSSDTVGGAIKRSRDGHLEGRFGAYEILGEIARGGMGVVYRARRDGTQEVVALKVLLDEKDPPEALVRRFEREVRAGKEIDHPNVVRVLDAGAVGGRLYFTMEFVQGRPFDKLLAELSLQKKVEVFEKIVRGVAQAHAKGFIHRDLKPQNVLVTEELVPKIADFGLAKSLGRNSSLTKTGAILGTIAYMSPEQAEGGGLGKLDERTDVYALGAMLYEILTGSVPFKASSNYATIRLILKEFPAHPSTLVPDAPAGLSAIALKALEKESAKRYATARELADEVSRWLEGTAVETRAPTLAGRLARWAKKRRLPLGACLLTASVAGGTMKVLAWRRSSFVTESTARADLVLAELAKPGTTADMVERLEVAAAATEGIPELAAKRSAILGAARAGRSLETEKPAESRPLLEAALGAAPLRWDIRRAYVNVLDALGEPSLAARCLEAAPEKGPELLERLGAERLELGDLAGARAALETAGEHAAPLLVRVLVLGRDPAALERARALPASEESAVLVAEALLATDQGRGVDALRMIERTRQDADFALRLAKDLLRCERAEEALAAFERARARGADPIRCLLGRAEAQLLAGRPEDARASLDDAARQARPGSTLHARALARIVTLAAIANQGEPKEAKADLDPLVRAARAAPGDAPALEKAALELGTRTEAVSAWCALARLRKKANDPAAQAAIDKALAIDPASEEALAFDPARAHEAFVHGQGDGARLLRASIVAFRVGACWGLPADQARAEALLALAERAAPWSGAPLIEQGRRQLLAQNKAGAKESLERGLALGEEPQGLTLLAGLVEPPRAEELATRALALDKASARALAVRGKARLDLGRAKEALADLEASLRLDLHDADAWEWKVAALHALGRPAGSDEEEAKLRRNALDVATKACERRDFGRALDYAPDAPDVVQAACEAIFDGTVSTDGDPILIYSRMIARRPAQFMNGIFERAAAASLQPSLADIRDGPDADSSMLFTAFVLRCVGIVRDRDTRPETLTKARLDLERTIGLDPSQMIAVAARGFIHSLEHRSELAREDLDRGWPYANGACVIIFARAVLHIVEGTAPGEELEALDRLKELTLRDFALELSKKETRGERVGVEPPPRSPGPRK